MARLAKRPKKRWKHKKCENIIRIIKQTKTQTKTFGCWKFGCSKLWLLESKIVLVRLPNPWEPHVCITRLRYCFYFWIEEKPNF